VAAAAAAARSALVSTTAMSSTPSRALRILAWCLPRCPTPMTATRSRSADTLVPPRTTDNGDASLVRRLEHVLAVQDERPLRIDRQRRRPSDPHRLDRRNADYRHVEPHILTGLRNLHDSHAGPG